MANKIVQAIYDLKDNVSAGLKRIGTAWKGAEKDADQASREIGKSTTLMSDKFAAAAATIGKLKGAFAGLLAGAGVLAFLAKIREGLQAIFDTGERFDDLNKKFTTAFGGLDQGKRALEGVKAIAENVPFSLEEVTSAAVALKQRGFDPLDGSLQALIDNTVATDGSAQDLIDTINTLGKAALKGEIGTKALVSLTEKGIPVFRLLGQALGKSEEQIRAMAASGKLGTAEIKLLIAQLGKLRAGAAASEVGDLDAQLTKLRDTLELVKNDLAQGGSLEVAREQFADLNEAVRNIAASPEFQRLKETFNQTFESGVEAVRAFIDNFDFAEVLTEINQLTGEIDSLFKLLKASDVIVEPLIKALSALTLPTELMKKAVADALNVLGQLADDTGDKVEETGKKVEGTITPISALRNELDLAKAAVKAFDDAQRAIKAGLTVEAKLMADSLGFLEGSAQEAQAKVSALFATFQQDPNTRLGDVALALAEVGSRAQNVAQTVRDTLGVELKKLSGEDLLRFQTAAQSAFETMKVSASEAATVLDSILAEALSRLGVAGELLGQKITAAGQQIIATFQAVVANARATSDQIEAAFAGALANITTVAEAEALGAALQRAGEQGKLGLDAMARSATDLRNRIEELKNAADPLADAFKRLGITSQRELDRIAQTAREDFAAVESAARAGGAQLDDVSRAFEAMARAQLAATANASKFEQETVRATLRAKGESLGLEDALIRLGIAGEKAGEQVASGADGAAAALRRAASAADDAAAAAESNAGANTSNASSFIYLAGAADQAGFAIEGVSEKFAQLAAQQVGRVTTGGRRGESNLFKDLQEQNRLLDEQIALTQAQNAQFDETAQRIAQLRGQYDLLSDDRIRQLAEEQRRLEDNLRRQEEQAQRERERAEQAARGAQERSNTSRGDGATSASTKGSTGSITVTNNFNGLRELDDAGIQRVSQKIEEIMRRRR
jgi:tape measure domain-containing protein